MIFSGLFHLYYKDFGLSKELADAIQFLHTYFGYAITLFVFVHIAGLVIEYITKNVNIFNYMLKE